MTPLLAQVCDWTRSQIREPDPKGVSAIDAQRAALAVRVLRGPEGPAFLELLAEMTVLRPALDPRLHGSASHDYAQRRTGENAVFASLIHLLDTHDALQEKPDDDRILEPHERPVFGWFDTPGHAAGSGDRYAAERYAVDGGSAFDGDGFDPGGLVGGS